MRLLNTLLYSFLFTIVNAQWQPMDWPPKDPNFQTFEGGSQILQHNNQLYLATKTGIFTSLDQGESWERSASFAVGFIPSTMEISEKGIYVAGLSADSIPEFYENADFSGLIYQKLTGFGTKLPQIKIGDHFYRHNPLAEKWNAASSTWQAVTIPGVGQLDFSFTWHHDTIYGSHGYDRRIYRSTDGCTSFQLHSTLPLGNFKKTNGLSIGQRLTPDNSDPMTELVYSFDEGQTRTAKEFGGQLYSPEYIWVQKYGEHILIGNKLTRKLFEFNNATLKLDTVGHNFDRYKPDKNHDNGAFIGGCHFQFNNLFQVTKDCPSTDPKQLTNVFHRTYVDRIYNWNDSLYLSASYDSNHVYYPVYAPTGNFYSTKRFYLMTPGTSTPKYLATADTLFEGGFDYYWSFTFMKDSIFYPAFDGVYAVSPNNPMVSRKDSLGDVWGSYSEFRRSNDRLYCLNNQYKFQRTFNGPWAPTTYTYLYSDATPDYFYSVYYDKVLQKSATAETEIKMPFEDVTNEGISVHDSSIIVYKYNFSLNSPHQHFTYLYSSDLGQTFSYANIDDQWARKCRLVNGRLFLFNENHLLTYNELDQNWLSYEGGLPKKLITSFDELDGRLVISVRDSGLYTRNVEPIFKAHGTVFFDENNNAVKDVGEQPVPNVAIEAANTNLTYFSKEDGSFRSYTDLPTEMHKVKLPNATIVAVPAQITTNNADKKQDFAIQIPADLRDLSLGMSQSDVFRPGFQTNVRFNLKNHFRPQTGVGLAFQFDPSKLDILNAIPWPTQVDFATGTAFWSIGDLGALADTAVEIRFSTNSTAEIGDEILLKATVSGQLSEADLTNNSAQIKAEIVGSFDPNDKLVSSDFLKIQNPPTAERLTYTIRFQNTGNYRADFVTLIDTLDMAKFDVSSIEFVAASHSFDARIRHENVLKVKFDNIKLQPQSQSETASQGFLTFTIKTKSPLATPTEIRNRADIYFDFNPPIRTQDAVTKVDFVVGTADIGAKNPVFQVSPNPASQFLNIDFLPNQPTGTGKATLFSTNGIPVLTKILFVGKNQIPLKNLPTGTYFIQLSDERGKTKWAEIFKKE